MVQGVILPSVKAFIGSLVAMFVGFFSIVGGLQSHPPAFDGVVGGVTMILGALAYRSAKRRRLGLKPDSALRRGVEISLLVIVFLPIVVLGLKGLGVVANHPVSGIFVPLWSVTAYLWVCNRKVVAETGIPSIR